MNEIQRRPETARERKTGRKKAKRRKKERRENQDMSGIKIRIEGINK